MDQTALVESGHRLIDQLTLAGVPPRAVMWVHNTDADLWRLWIVPSKKLSDRREFYRRLAEIITKNRDTIKDIDAADAEMMLDTHPAIQGVSKMVRVKGKSSVFLRNNMVNGFYIPDGIVLLMDL